MHKGIAISLIISGGLFYAFSTSQTLGIIFVAAGGIIYLFGGKLEDKR